MGLDLIEWTYDPMQAMNAHLNSPSSASSRGVRGERVRQFEQPAASGNPTDRFVANGGFASRT